MVRNAVPPVLAAILAISSVTCKAPPPSDGGAPSSSVSRATGAPAAFPSMTAAPDAAVPLTDGRLELEGMALPRLAASGSGSSCTRVAPRQPSLSAASRRDTCVILEGWWGVGALLVPQEREGVAGFRLLRPFSHVVVPNDSLGSPSWAALESVFVDHGWFQRDAIASTPVRTSAPEQMFDEPVEITGTVRAAPIKESAWTALRELVDELEGPLYGAYLLTGVVLVLDESSARPDAG